MDAGTWTDAELATLVGLVRRLVHADDQLSPAEQAALAELQQRVGVPRWNAAVVRARAELVTEGQLWAAAGSVRPELRAELLAELAHLAGADAVVAAEAAILRRFAALGP